MSKSWSEYSFLEKLKYNWRMEWQWKVKGLFYPSYWPPIRFCKNISRCFKISKFYWNVPDFDWSGVSMLMRFQLTRLANVLENGYTASGSRDSHKIRICIELLKRLENGTYEDIALSRYPCHSWDDELFGRVNAMSIRPNEVATGEMLNSEYRPKNTKFWIQQSRDLQKQYEDLLFKILKTQYQGWWE